MHTKISILPSKKTLRTCLFVYKTRFAVEKKNQKIFWGIFKSFFCVVITKMPVIQTTPLFQFPLLNSNLKSLFNLVINQ